MRILFFTALLCVVCRVAAQGQPAASPVREFGKVSVEELEISRCKFDSTASALILFDKGEITQYPHQVTIYRRHTRVIILTQEGINDWANSNPIYISRYADSFSKLRASTYNLENGRIVESRMRDEADFRTHVNKYLDRITFTLPDVRVGSVIEYSYQIRNDFVTIRDWSFQSGTPKLWSEFEMNIPPGNKYYEDWQGSLNPVIKESRNEGVNKRWAMKDIPAMRAEPNMPNPESYECKVSFFRGHTFMKNQPLDIVMLGWDALNQNLVDSEFFGGQIEGSDFLKAKVDSIITEIPEPERRVWAIRNYLVRSVKWSGFTDVIPDRLFEKVLASGTGSSSEINGMLVSMLRKAGLLAYPVLIRTVDKGKQRIYRTSLDEFNYVLALVKLGSKNLFVDATDPYVPVDLIPEYCLNGIGLVVMDSVTQWVKLNNRRSRSVVNLSGSISGDAGFAGKAEIALEGMYAVHARRKLKETEVEPVEDSNDDDLFPKSNWTPSGLKTLNEDDPGLPLRQEMQVTGEELGQAEDPLIYLNPVLVGRLEANPYTSPERIYPVEIPSGYEVLYMAKLSLPGGFVVDELPKSQIYSLPGNGGKYTYNIARVGAMISVTSHLVINKTLFEPGEYPSLREFFSMVVAKQSELMVLRKEP